MKRLGLLIPLLIAFPVVTFCQDRKVVGEAGYGRYIAGVPQ